MALSGHARRVGRCPLIGGRGEVRDAREAMTAIGANAKTLVFASTTNTDHAPEGLSGSLRRTATTLRKDTVQRKRNSAPTL